MAMFNNQMVNELDQNFWKFTIANGLPEVCFFNHPQLAQIKALTSKIQGGAPQL